MCSPGQNAAFLDCRVGRETLIELQNKCAHVEVRAHHPDPAGDVADLPGVEIPNDAIAVDDVHDGRSDIRWERVQFA